MSAPKINKVLIGEALVGEGMDFTRFTRRLLTSTL